MLTTIAGRTGRKLEKTPLDGIPLEKNRKDKLVEPSTEIKIVCLVLILQQGPRSVMDMWSVFETGDPGSIPGREAAVFFLKIPNFHFVFLLFVLWKSCFFRFYLQKH